MGFPPKTKNTQKNIPDTDSSGATKGVISKGNGGIPASLRLKNASVKDAPSAQSFTDRLLAENGLGKTDSDKTVSSF